MPPEGTGHRRTDSSWGVGHSLGRIDRGMWLCRSEVVFGIITVLIGAGNNWLPTDATRERSHREKGTAGSLLH